MLIEDKVNLDIHHSDFLLFLNAVAIVRNLLKSDEYPKELHFNKNNYYKDTWAYDLLFERYSCKLNSLFYNVKTKRRLFYNT